MYLLAVNNQPLSAFETAVKIQKSNGVKLIEGLDSSAKAKEFINYLADSARRKLLSILTEASFFSILTDGSQARKTGCEKELILARVVRSGESTFYCIGLQDIDSYGDATSDNLKLSIDHAFLEMLNLPPLMYQKKMISAISDGASVNTGSKNGLFVQLKQADRPWLLTAHCVSHRVELALKGSLGSEFSEIKEFMVTIYYTLSNQVK